MADENKTKAKHNGWNRVLITLLSILLIVTAFVTILRDNFISSTKAYLFLKESQAFENVANLTKDAIRSNLPDKVKNNFLEKAIIEKLMDIVITPENVAKIAEPGIKSLYTASAKIANLADENISYNTVELKEQAQKYLPSLGLPSAFAQASEQFIKAVPDEIKVLDVKSNPNSPLALFIKLRNAYKSLNATANVLWGLVIVNLIGLVLLNLKSLARLFRSYAWAFGVAGVISLLMSYLAPQLATVFMGTGANATEQDLNSLIQNLLTHYFDLMKGYGWLYILIAVVALLAYYLLNSKGVRKLLQDGTKGFVGTIKSNFIKKS